MKRALVCGAGGFIGHHLVSRLKREGYWVRGIDLKKPFSETEADHFIIGDLRDQVVCRAAMQTYDEVYQLAAEMGGAEYVFTGENDADIMHNSAIINLNILNECRRNHIEKVFFSSSVCMYPINHGYQDCNEDSAYPANPDSEYGWEKIFSERLYLAFRRNYGIQTYIARFQNTYGPNSAWKGIRAKAPAALCRKIAMAADDGEIEVLGDGQQRRSYIYIDDVIEGILRLVRSDFSGPVNIGTEEIVTVDQMVDIIADIAGKKIRKKYIPGPVGAHNRGTINELIRKKLQWAPISPLKFGLKKTYEWVAQQVRM